MVSTLIALTGDTREKPEHYFRKYISIRSRFSTGRRHVAPIDCFSIVSSGEAPCLNGTRRPIQLAAILYMGATAAAVMGLCKCLGEKRIALLFGVQVQKNTREARPVTVAAEQSTAK